MSLPVCVGVCVFASDTLRISGFLLMTSYLHKQAFANASRRHRHAEAVRLIFAALGLARRNTHCRYWTLGTSSWPVLKVTPQVATPGAECAVCDCLVWMAVHHFQPVTSSQYYHISSWLPISFQSSYLANLTQSGHPTVIIHHSPLLLLTSKNTYLLPPGLPLQAGIIPNLLRSVVLNFVPFHCLSSVVSSMYCKTLNKKRLN